MYLEFLHKIGHINIRNTNVEHAKKTEQPTFKLVKMGFLDSEICTPLYTAFYPISVYSSCQ